jgi:hypothetical protein
MKSRHTKQGSGMPVSDVVRNGIPHILIWRDSPSTGSGQASRPTKAITYFEPPPKTIPLPRITRIFTNLFLKIRVIRETCTAPERSVEVSVAEV